MKRFQFFFSKILWSEALVYNSFFFSEQPFYGSYSTSDFHTNTLISHAFNLPTRQDGVENRDKVYSAILLGCVRLGNLDLDFKIRISDLQSNAKSENGFQHWDHAETSPFGFSYLPFDRKSEKGFGKIQHEKWNLLNFTWFLKVP